MWDKVFGSKLELIMPSQVSFRGDLGCVEVVYYDDLTLPQLRETLQAIAAQLRKHGVTRLFADCLDLRAGPTVSDMYELVSDLRDMEDAPPIKQALVLPSSPAAAEGALFWETLSINRGMLVQSFTTREAAMEWLLKA